MSNHKAKSCCGSQSHTGSQAGSGDQIDPICGMTVDANTAKNTYEHNSKKYYFCCSSCLKKFVADPDKYVKS